MCMGAQGYRVGKAGNLGVAVGWRVMGEDRRTQQVITVVGPSTEEP